MNREIIIPAAFDGTIETAIFIGQILDDESNILTPLMEHSDARCENRVGIGFNIKTFFKDHELDRKNINNTTLELHLTPSDSYDDGASGLYLTFYCYTSPADKIELSDWKRIINGKQFYKSSDTSIRNIPIPTELLINHLDSSENYFKLGIVGVVLEHEKGYSTFCSSKAGVKAGPKLKIIFHDIVSDT